MSEVCANDGWELVATLEGGIVAGLAVAHETGGRAHAFAATPVGVFASVDGGVRWARLGSEATLPDVTVVVPSASFERDRAVYAGSRDGLFRWDQANDGWTHLVSGARVLSLSCRPADDGATVLLLGTEADGILLSRDDGRTWVGANPGLLDLAVLALAASPDFVRDGVAFAATPSGLYRTRNGAASWRAVEVDDWDELAVQCLAISPDFAEDRRLLAGTEERGLLRSEDAGRTWEAVPELDGRSVTACVLTGRGAVVATDVGLFRSDDDGASWQQLGADLGPVLAFAAVTPSDDGDGDVLLAGLPGGGVMRSVDGGGTWEAANAGLAATLFTDLCAVPSDSARPTLVLADAAGGVRRSEDGGRTWSSPASTEAAPILARLACGSGPDGATWVFGAADTGLVRSADAGVTWKTLLADDAGAGPLALAPTGAGLVVAVGLGDGRIRVSRDGGETWLPEGLPIGAGALVDLALSPAIDADQTLYAATRGAADEDGIGELAVWRSVDGGRRWQPWWGERGPGGIALATTRGPSDGHTLLIGTVGRVLRPMARTAEIRAAARRPIWAEASLPDGAANILRLVVTRRGARGRVVVGATDRGAYRSDDDATSFIDWNAGLDGRAVVALALGRSLDGGVVAHAVGLGGAIWRRAVLAAI